MHTNNCLQKSVAVLAFMLVLVASLLAQETRPEIAIRGSGFFMKGGNGSGTTRNVLAEGGALVFSPTNRSYGFVPGASRQAVGASACGGGFDCPMPAFRNVAFRLEFRGLIHDKSDFDLHNLHSDAVINTAEPSAGLVFKF